MSARKTNPIKTQKVKLKTETDRDSILSNAHRIVSSAVNVLEEEIAAGILAAKNLESKLINVDEIRSNQDELINRIRRDTHEALDLFLDAFAALTQQLNGIIEKVSLKRSIVKTLNRRHLHPILKPLFWKQKKHLK